MITGFSFGVTGTVKTILHADETKPLRDFGNIAGVCSLTLHLRKRFAETFHLGISISGYVGISSLRVCFPPLSQRLCTRLLSAKPTGRQRFVNR